MHTGAHHVSAFYHRISPTNSFNIYIIKYNIILYTTAPTDLTIHYPRKFTLKQRGMWAYEYYKYELKYEAMRLSGSLFVRSRLSACIPRTILSNFHVDFDCRNAEILWRTVCLPGHIASVEKSTVTGQYIVHHVYCFATAIHGNRRCF